MATLWLLLLLIPLLDVSRAERQLQETISMTEDGWRPIVGVAPRRRNPEGSNNNNKVKAVDIEIVRSESPISHTQPPEDTLGKNRNPVPEKSNKIQAQNQKPKPPSHAKVAYHTIPGHHFVHSNGVSVSRPSQFGTKKQVVKVAPPSPFFGSKRKPIRGPAASHSIRNEVYVPSGLSSSNVKIREAQGLAQPTRFGSHPGPIFQQFKSQPLYIFTQTASQNDVYSKNLVPPPPPPVEPPGSNAIRFADGPTKQFDLRPQLILENLVAEPVKLKTKAPSVTDVQVTKENLKVFHQEQKTPDYVDYDYHAVTSGPQQHKWQTYEVTEGKWVDNPTPYVFDFVQQQPPSARRPSRPREPIVELNVPQFLPTPYKPEGAIPTSATHPDISTVFSQVSAKVKPHHQRPPPHLFDVKEVSTHYPILGKPAFVTDLATDNPVAMTENSEIATTTTEEAVRKTKGRRRRPQPRRPTSSTTTEEPRTEAATTTEAERARKRQRLRPYAYKTSYQDEEGFTTTPGYDSEETTAYEKTTRGRNRYRIRGGNNNQQYLQQKRLSSSIKKQGSSTNGLLRQNSREEDTERPQVQEDQDLEEKLKDFSYEKTSDEAPTVKIEEVTVEATTRETPQEVVTQESDQFTLPSTIEQAEDEATTPMVPETTTAAVITTTSTSSTVKPTKVRGKLHKLNAANRPRFSVKDYRQRLTQHVSSTAPTTASGEISRTTYESTRLRFPNRFRARPGAAKPSPSSTTPTPDEQDTEPSLRRRFKPKDPRHSASTTTEPSDPTTKPYRNYRQKTTEQPSKVSIRPNLFSAKRRSPLTHRPTEETKNVTTTEESVTEEIIVDRKGEEDEEYTKRISDLTSSVQNEPGMFKSVASANSRMVPNHFTIATDDPILPIEAFFTNIEKE